MKPFFISGNKLSKVVSIQVGQVAPLGPDRVASGFAKTPVRGPVRVHRTNLEGDAQADLRVHGGLEKAVYAYAQSRYEAWRSEFPEHGTRLVPGAFGENLTISNMTEDQLCLGDIHAIGSALLQVCQPRRPCFKLSLRFDDSRIPRAMVRSGRSGWYYRVIQEGWIEPDDVVHLLDRPNPDFPFRRLIAIIYGAETTRGELAMLASSSGAPRWLRTAAATSLSDMDSPIATQATDSDAKIEQGVEGGAS